MKINNGIGRTKKRQLDFFNNIEDDYGGNQTTEFCQNELEDDPPIRGTRLLLDIYQRCNVVIYEPSCCEEARKDPKWKKAMEDEISMIKKTHGSWLTSLKIEKLLELNGFSE